MKPAELSGLVLTHGNRNNQKLYRQLSEICGQLVIVHDTRTVAFDRTSTYEITGVRDVEVTLVERQFDTFPKQRNAGIERAFGVWALSVDSDELLAPELIAEIADLEAEDGVDVYTMPRRETLFGKRLKVAGHSGSTTSVHPRLFKTKLRYNDFPLVHERFVGDEQLRVKTLAGALEHYPTENIVDIYRKAFRYGRLRGVSFAAEGLTHEYPKTAANLARYVAEDGVLGLAAAGIKIAYGLGVRMPSKLKQERIESPRALTTQ